jgi:hypothetical protein
MEETTVDLDAVHKTMEALSLEMKQSVLDLSNSTGRILG